MAANGKTRTATPWGAAELVDELTLPQRAGEKRFASVVQLLAGPRGERLVRFAYTTGESSNSECFKRELMDHYRLVFEKA